MHCNIHLSALSLLSLLVPTLAIPTPEAPHDETTFHSHNANHITNAIHSSMRQWGSSLNHNGMSFFLATVPTGTQLYHGRSDKEPVKGMEWLAFEPEHALIFARPRGGRGPPGKGGPPNGGHEEWNKGDKKHGKGHKEGEDRPLGKRPGGKGRPPHPPHHGDAPPDGHHWGPSPKGHHDGPRHGPSPPTDDDGLPAPPPKHPHGAPPHHEKDYPDDLREHPHHGPRPDCDEDSPLPPHNGGQHPIVTRHVSEPAKTGFLHTYVPKHDLKLLYIDGMSAGKTDNGTLDTQDLLLLNMTSHGAMGGEYERAQGLCNLSSTLWENKIDGVLRMEGGFEIILCEFENHLDRVDVMAVMERDGGGGMGWGYQKAITERYHGIGGGRVVLDYSNFVTAFKYPGLDLWTNDVVSDTKMPRLQNVGEEDLKKIKDAITTMILQNTTSTSESKIDWQAVTDQLLQRYSAPLHHLFTDTSVRSSKEAYATYLSTLLQPFIDNTGRNSSAEIHRCISQFVPPISTPPSAAPSLAHKSIHAVSHHLCATLLSASDIANLSLSRSLSSISPPPSAAVELVDSLKEYLQWTSWKWCQGGCEDTEICVVPIWPMGTHELHEIPRCMAEGEGRNGGPGGGYWGRRGPGRGPPGEGPPGEGPPGQGPPREGPTGDKGRGKHNGFGMRKHKGGKCRNQRKKGFWAVIKKESRVVRGWFMGFV